MRGFLAVCRLSEYAAAFEAKGYDDVQYFLDIAEEGAQLALLASEVGFKVGHKARFEHEVKKARAAGGVVA